MRKYAIGTSPKEFDVDDLAKILEAILNLFDRACYEVDVEIAKYKSRSIKETV